MFGLVVTLVALSQGPEYVADYKPKVGDKVVLARDEAGRKVPIAKSDGAALGFKDIVEGADFNYEMVVGGNGELAEIDGGTAAQIVEDIKYLKEPIFFKVRILDGPSRGKTTYAYATFCRKPDPAFAKAAAEVRKKRAPLDKGAIVAEVEEALVKARPDDGDEDLGGKKKVVREAIDPVREKYKAGYKEINALATRAGVFVMLNGRRYDVAGNLARK
jgi:uncharacterized protein YlzI (FlbEa/FlbD family)